MTFYTLTKGYTIPGNQGTQTLPDLIYVDLMCGQGADRHSKFSLEMLQSTEQVKMVKFMFSGNNAQVVKVNFLLS